MDKEQGTGVCLKRRDFLKTLGASTLFILSSPHESLANQPPAQTSPDQLYPEVSVIDPEFDWDSLYGLLKELKEFKFQVMDVDKMSENLEVLQKGYTPRIDRDRILIKLHQEQELNPNKPSLTVLYQKRLGKIDPKFLAPKDVIPFYAEKDFLKYTFDYIKDTLEEIKKAKLSGQSSVLDAEEKLVVNVLTLKAIFRPGPEGNELGRCSNQGEPEIVPDDSIIELTAAGRNIFEGDKKLIRGTINTLPVFKIPCSRIQLYRKAYGPSLQFHHPGLLGWFSPGRNEKGEFVSQFWLTMDQSESGAYPPSQTLGHEGFGHGFDVSINPSIAYFFSPEDSLEVLTAQMQELENPHWSRIGLTIPELFAPRKRLRNDLEIRQMFRILTRDFKDIITEYPLNVIVNNLYRVGVSLKGDDVSSKLDEALRHWPFKRFNAPKFAVESDEVNTSIRKAFDMLGLASKIDKVKNEEQLKADANHTFGILTPGINPNTRFETLEDFLKVYAPQLEKEAKMNNLRSKLILWGVKNYQKEFENYGLLWDLTPYDEYRYIPTQTHKEAFVWFNYCKEIVSYMTLYHAVLNDVKEIRSWFSEDVWGAYSKHFYRTTKLAYGELWAEGVAYSHAFGTRLGATEQEGYNCPFRRGLNHIAWKLVNTKN